MASKHGGKYALLIRHYEKIIVAVAFIGLLVSLILLSQRILTKQQEEDNYRNNIRTLVKKFPDSTPMDEMPLTRAQWQLQNAFQMGSSVQRRFLIPEERMWCLNCRQPIPFSVDKCPLCGKEQPDIIEDEWDTNGNGIPDVWEDKYGLDPNDPLCAEQVWQNGWTYMDMWNAKLDPSDRSPENHPPLIGYLYVESIEAIPFTMVLRGTMKTGDGRVKYQINSTVNNQTMYAYLGEEIGKTGWKIVDAKAEKIMKERPGLPAREEEVHTLTLQKGDDTVVIVQDEPPPFSDYIVKMTCSKGFDDTITVRKGGEFELDDIKYILNDVDKTQGTVLIMRTADETGITISSSERGE